jgi:hypothetical protein
MVPFYSFAHLLSGPDLFKEPPSLTNDTIPPTTIYPAQEKPPTTFTSHAIPPLSPDFSTLNIDPSLPPMDLSSLPLILPDTNIDDIPTEVIVETIQQTIIASDIALGTADDNSANNTSNITNDTTSITNNSTNIPNDTNDCASDTSVDSSNTPLDTSVGDSSSTSNNNGKTNPTKTRSKRKKGDPSKRGRKPAQNPPYTKLYKQPWLDGWATCKRLALEYIEETKLQAQRANLHLNDVRRLPSHVDLSNGNSKRTWTPMELILARAFLKEADLINTSTKKGATIRSGIFIEQLPELIANSVLPENHAVHYVPKERKKDPNKPKKEKKEKEKKEKKEKKERKPKNSKKQKIDQDTLPSTPVPVISPFFQTPLSIPKDPLTYSKC